LYNLSLHIDFGLGRLVNFNCILFCFRKCRG